MTPERYARIDHFYHQALELPAEQRDAFLTTACADDELLRQEVLSLLAAHDSAASFIETPAIAAAAAAVAADHRPIAPGARIGPYEVRSLLGRGGMGDVYQAHDPRLNRDVALKVLPEAFAVDVQRLARFEREARLLAALNHPNIATLFGIEEWQGRRILVLELVQGSTLERTLAAGPIPMAKALAVAVQIVEALEAAHEHGIIHRDLKPANILVRPDGVVKVLDLGLAKPLDAEGGGAQGQTTALTEARMVVGTVPYMSPEQARGLGGDQRIDIWAFGCVLFEMLTGRRAFAGETQTDVVAAVINRTPDWNTLPAAVPPLVRRLLQRCLEKDPRQRLRHIGDARSDLKEPYLGVENPPATRRTRVRSGAIAAGAAAALIVALTSVWTFSRPRTDAPSEPVHLTTTLAPDVSVNRGPGLGSSVAVSPNGRTVVIAGTGKDGARLYWRPLDRLETKPLAGTERGSGPFFSWDGQWIGFFADGLLKRVPAAGGAAVDIVKVPFVPAGASWGPDDRIVFAYGGSGQLQSVDARGGSAEPLSPGTISGYNPDVLPDGRHVLYDSDGWIHLLDRLTSRTTRLVEGSAPRYARGYVMLSRGPTLLAAPFDSSRYELTGPVVPVVQDVAGDASPGGGRRHYAVSAGGTLAYVASPAQYSLVVVAPDGTERLIGDGARMILNPQFSPDGRFIAAATSRTGPPDLWIHDLQTGTASQLTFNGGRAPVWMDDGASITYSHLGERGGIYAQRIDGRESPRQLLSLDSFHWLVGWTPDTRTLAYGVMEGAPSSIMALTTGQSRRIVGPGSIWGGRLSQDGRSLAYYSLDSGNFEVFVTPFPDGGTRWLIAEGTDPAWAPDGKEIYYRSGARLMAARLERESGIRVVSRRVVVEPFLPPFYDDYDVHPDGRTLAMVRPTGSTQAREVSIIVDWVTELRRLLPAQ